MSMTEGEGAPVSAQYKEAYHTSVNTFTPIHTYIYDQFPKGERI